MNSPKFFYCSFLVIFITVCSAKSQDVESNLVGYIKDQQGAAIAEAEVALYDQTGNKIVEISDKNGSFRLRNLIPGTFFLRIQKSGFAVYEDKNLDIPNNSEKILQIVLEVQKIVEKVEVPLASDQPNTDPNNNKDAVVLKGSDLDSLPDDPEALEAALKALAGTAGGPDGGQIFIDGFSSRNIPPKTSIQEVRINRNPFSAEFDRIGYGRIEIITKVGKTDLSGSVFYRNNNDKLNARNPFALIRPTFQSNRYGGDISGSFLKKKHLFLLISTTAPLPTVPL